MRQLTMKKYEKDTLAPCGGVKWSMAGLRFQATNADDNVRLVYEYHVKIKIFDKAAFNEGSVLKYRFISETWGGTMRRFRILRDITILHK